MNPDFIVDVAPHLDAIARQAFEVLAGMAPKSFVAQNQEPGNFEVEAWVSYEGGQTTPSTLLITTNARFAVDFSRRFLGMLSLEEVNDDVLDAIGELANTVGGNFKGLFSVDTILSTPTITKVDKGSEQHHANITLAELPYAFEKDGLCVVKLLGPNEG